MSLSLSSPGERKRGKIPRRHCCRHRSKPQNPTTTTTTEMRQPHKLSRPKQAQTLAKSLGQKGVKTGGGGRRCDANWCRAKCSTCGKKCIDILQRLFFATKVGAREVPESSAEFNDCIHLVKLI